MIRIEMHERIILKYITGYPYQAFVNETKIKLSDMTQDSSNPSQIVLIFYV